MMEAGHKWVLGLWSFAVAAAYVPVIPSSVTLGRWAALGLGAAALIWTVKIERSPGHWLMAALLAWMVAGILWTTSGWETAGELALWAMMAAVFCVAFDLDDVDPIWWGFGLGVTLSALVAIAQSFGADPVKSIYDKGWVGLFLSKNMAADVATIAVVGAMSRRRIVLLPGAIVAMAALGAARTPAFALAVTGIFFAWVSWPRCRRWFVVPTILAAVAVVLLAAHGVIGQVNDRLQIWELVAMNLSLFGDGAGTLPVAATGIEYAHNEFLHYAFELGIGSLLLWGLFAHALRSGPVLERCALVAILALAVAWFPFHAPAPAFMAMVLAGHLCGVRHRACLAEHEGRMAGASGLRQREATAGATVRGADDPGLRAPRPGVAGLSAVVGGGRRVPARPQDQVGARTIRAPIPGDRA